MEIQLKELIEEIKKEGVEVAEEKSASIIDAAKAEADKILSQARAEAEKIISSAKQESDRFHKASEASIAQAGRNLLISFRESVAKELSALTGEKIAAAYSEKGLSEVILKAVSAWSESPEKDDLAVLLNESDLKLLEESLLSALRERLLSDITLKPNENFAGGFRIAVSGGQAYYDYSADAVCEMLSTYLSERVTKILKEAEK